MTTLLRLSALRDKKIPVCRERSVAWPEEEVDVFAAVLAAGALKDQIKATVTELVNARLCDDPITRRKAVVRSAAALRVTTVRGAS